MKYLLKSIKNVFALFCLYERCPTIKFVEPIYIVNGYALDSR